MNETPDYIRRTPTDADMAAAEADLMESPEFLRSEIERLRSALAARTEECARVAQPQHVVTGRMHGAWDRGYWEGRKDAAAAIRALQGHSQWRGIESAPKTGSVLLWDNGVWIAEWFDTGKHCGWDAGEVIVDNPTHWQPLPSPPSEKEGGQG